MSGESFRSRRLKGLAEAIGFFDSVRAGQLQSTEGVEKRLRGIAQPKDLGRVKRDFLKAVSPVKSSARARNLVRLLTVLQLITFQYFSIVLVVMLVTMFRSQPSWPVSLAFLFSPVVMFVMLILATGFLAGKWLIEKRISKAKESVLKLESRKKDMKALAQKYVDFLAAEIRRNKEDPSKYKFKLLYTDYAGIKIVDKPSFFANFHTAVVSSEERSTE
jgi:hypothetical protein